MALGHEVGVAAADIARYKAGLEQDGTREIGDGAVVLFLLVIGLAAAQMGEYPGPAVEAGLGEHFRAALDLAVPVAALAAIVDRACV